MRHRGQYMGARQSQPGLVQAVGDGYQVSSPLAPGDVAHVGLIGFPVAEIPSSARPAQDPAPQPGKIVGVVWRDFTPGGGGQVGQVDPGESGLPDLTVQLVHPKGLVPAQTPSDPTGDFAFANMNGGSYRLGAP